jgi:Uma2 family endonuclease
MRREVDALPGTAENSRSMKALGCTGETRALLENVSWSTYEALLEDMGPHRGRMAYEEGLLEILSPSFEHERIRRLMGRLLDVYSDELEIDMSSAGSVTMKRELRRRGVEPDECYYIENESLVVEKKRIDLSVDPPPDLAIEIEITKSALDRLGIYAALGVPELWFYDGEKLSIHRLEPEGAYVRTSVSRVLPRLPVTEFEKLLSQACQKGARLLAREFRKVLRGLPR